MKIVPTETSLVVAGAWNPAILTPAWVIKHGLNKEESKCKVQVFLPAAAQGIVFEWPKYTLADLSFIVRSDAFVLLPPEHNTENFEFLQEIASRILKALPHTPITGVGHNFEYREQNPSAKDLKVFTDSRQDLADEMPAGWEATTALVAASFRNATGNVVVNIQRQFDVSAIAMKFNFHHAVTAIDQAVAVLEGRDGYARMTQSLKTAQHLADALYGGAQGE
jgi:hypothetical protein